MATRLQQHYLQKVIPDLIQQFGYKTIMEVPKITKITLNMGVGEAARDKKLITAAISDLEAIAGQKVVPTITRKSIATFKTREGMALGCKVTLRRDKMYEFLDRLVSIVFPRTRDFRGLNPRAFDGRGNYSLGIKEQVVFPEIEYDKIDKIRGLNVTITTTAKTDAEARALLKAFKFPLREIKEAKAEEGGDK